MMFKFWKIHRTSFFKFLLKSKSPPPLVMSNPDDGFESSCVQPFL